MPLGESGLQNLPGQGGLSLDEPNPQWSGIHVPLPVLSTGWLYFHLGGQDPCVKYGAGQGNTCLFESGSAFVLLVLGIPGITLGLVGGMVIKTKEPFW